MAANTQRRMSVEAENPSPLPKSKSSHYRRRSSKMLAIDPSVFRHSRENSMGSPMRHDETNPRASSSGAPLDQLLMFGSHSRDHSGVSGGPPQIATGAEPEFDMAAMRLPSPGNLTGGAIYEENELQLALSSAFPFAPSAAPLAPEWQNGGPDQSQYPQQVVTQPQPFPYTAPSPQAGSRAASTSVTSTGSSSAVRAATVNSLPDLDSAELVKAERKMRKNVREKQRRSELNERFEQLCRLFGMKQRPKKDKVLILTKTVNEIEALRKQNARLLLLRDALLPHVPSGLAQQLDQFRTELATPAVTQVLTSRGAVDVSQPMASYSQRAPTGPNGTPQQQMRGRSNTPVQIPSSPMTEVSDATRDAMSPAVSITDAIPRMRVSDPRFDMGTSTGQRQNPFMMQPPGPRYMA